MRDTARLQEPTRGVPKIGPSIKRALLTEQKRVSVLVEKICKGGSRRSLITAQVRVDCGFLSTAHLYSECYGLKSLIFLVKLWDEFFIWR